jgi:hypothetical protein
VPRVLIKNDGSGLDVHPWSYSSIRSR